MKKIKITYFIIIGLISLFLLIAHTFSLFSVLVDSCSILLLIILIFLPFINRLKKLKWGDLEAEITQEINKIEKSMDKVEFPSKVNGKEYSLKEAEDIKRYIFSLANNDPVLALAKIRIELEELIKKTYISKVLKGNTPSNFNLLRISSMLSELENRTSIDKTLLHNTKEVIMLCNKGIHGEIITAEQLYNIVRLGIQIIAYFYGYIG